MTQIGTFSGQFAETGYGPRPIVNVESLPKFVNKGWNEFIDDNYTTIRIENMNELPTDEHDHTVWRNCWRGWVKLIDPFGEMESAFLDPVDWNSEADRYEGKEFTVKG